MKKYKSFKRILLNVVMGSIFVIVGIVGSILTFSKGYNYAINITEESRVRQLNPNIKQLTLEVDKNTSLQQLSQVLYNNEFIVHQGWFTALGKLFNYSDKFISGTYSISSNMSNTEIFELLTTPPKQDDTIKFTIPEGYTISQIATRLEDQGIVAKEDFLRAVNERDYDYPFLTNIPTDSKYKLEGYLFPDTYIINKNATSEEIILKMLNRFEQVISQYSQYIRDTSYSLHEILTIASIIEQEAKLSEERPIISGVIYNRLDANMKLQMCSTIQYILEKRKTNLSYNDLKVESPYNTYRYDGLPVGPICVPGKEAIEAALLPDKNNYFFFVLKDRVNGSHAFSRTVAEHEQHKIKYQQTVDKNFYE